MILTYKIKHNRDFNRELNIAKTIAIFAINNRDKLTSKHVKHLGLKSMISNQILRKYGRNNKCKNVKNVNLIIPNQGIRLNKDNREIHVPCLKLKLNYYFPNNFAKINQIEINNEYTMISCEFIESPLIIQEKNLGVDLNTTGHCAVVGIPHTGKVYKMGKQCNHIHKKYKNIRKKLQKNKKFSKLKKIKNREKRIIKDINHKISKKIVNIAKENKCNINLENLKGIRKAKTSKKFRYSLNSWSFYQLGEMIRYKAKKLGVSISYIDPRYTSQSCSECGHLGKRNGKSFKCDYCNHVDHADSNAAFNIALATNG